MANQRDKALAFLATFEHLDADANVALRAPDCRHTMAPTSLNAPQGLTNEQFHNHLTSLQSVIASLSVTVKEIFAVEGSSQVTVWATSEATFRPEAMDDELEKEGGSWMYRGEYMFVFVFDEAGERIERIVEFIDSMKFGEVMALIERAKGNLAKQSAGGL